MLEHSGVFSKKQLIFYSGVEFLVRILALNGFSSLFVVVVVCVGVSGKVVVKRVERFCTVGLRSGYK